MAQRIKNILDIDLDFFVENICYGEPTDGESRLTDPKHKPWPPERVTAFLEKNLKLNRKNKIPGAFFVHHEGVFHFLKKIILESPKGLKFRIDHIDGHADLGSGDGSFMYICSKLLRLPVEERYNPKADNYWQELCSGNFLAYALAARWVERLNHITHPGKGREAPLIHFKNFDKTTDHLQLKIFSIPQVHRMDCDFTDLTFEEANKKLVKTKPEAVEPAVPYKVIPYPEFKTELTYDYILLTQSPGFTTKKSDALIPLIREYFECLPD